MKVVYDILTGVTIAACVGGILCTYLILVRLWQHRKSTRPPCNASMGGHTENGIEWTLHGIYDSRWDRCPFGTTGVIVMAGAEHNCTVEWVTRG